MVKHGYKKIEWGKFKHTFCVCIQQYFKEIYIKSSAAGVCVVYTSASPPKEIQKTSATFKVSSTSFSTYTFAGKHKYTSLLCSSFPRSSPPTPHRTFFILFNQLWIIFNTLGKISKTYRKVHHACANAILHASFAAM